MARENISLSHNVDYGKGLNLSFDPLVISSFKNTRLFALYCFAGSYSTLITCSEHRSDLLKLGKSFKSRFAIVRYDFAEKGINQTTKTTKEKSK